MPSPIPYYDDVKKVQGPIARHFVQLVNEIKKQVPEAVEVPGKKNEFMFFGVGIRLALQWGILNDRVVGVVLQSHCAPLDAWTERCPICLIHDDGKLQLLHLDATIPISEPDAAVGFFSEALHGVLFPCDVLFKPTDEAQD